MFVPCFNIRMFLGIQLSVDVCIPCRAPHLRNFMSFELPVKIKTLKSTYKHSHCTCMCKVHIIREILVNEMHGVAHL